MQQQYLNLDADEVMVLTDRVQNGDCGTEEAQCSALALLLKLGSAYVELLGSATKKAGTIPVAVTESETWLLRSKVTSGDKTQSDGLFGIKLLCKLYRILLAYNMDIEIESGGVDDEFTEDRKAALKRWIGN